MVARIHPVPVRSQYVDPLEAALPPPDAVAERVAHLRATMFGAVKAEHVEGAMSALGEKAAAGDLNAIRLLVSMLSPKAAAAPTATAAVLVQGGGRE